MLKLNYAANYCFYISNVLLTVFRRVVRHSQAWKEHAGNREDKVRHFELTVESGVRVTSVEEGSPARTAGLEEGDVIVRWDGTPVAGIDDLHRLLTEDYLGRSAELTLIRRTQQLERSITPVELPVR
jgi:S1-C subfamily serine protease